MFGRNKIAMIVGEFLGAGALAAAVYTIMARTSFPLFSGMAAGLTAAVFTLAVGSVSGAHINPAVTFGMWTVRKIQTTTAVVYIVAQMLGGVAAWYLLKYLLGHSLTSIAGTQFEWKVFVSEGIGAAVFVFGFVSAVMQKFEGGKLAAAIGGSLLLGILVASLASNAVLNPAVAVGIQSWNWAYATAPLAGALVGANLYAMLFAANPVSWSMMMMESKPAASTTSRTTTRRKTRRRTTRR